MLFEFILAAFLSNYLRKKLQPSTYTIPWDKILTAAMVVSIGLMVISTTVSSAKNLVGIAIYTILCGQVYISLTYPEFSTAKSMVHAVIPYIIIAFLTFIIRWISRPFYAEWNNYFETGQLFAVIWMIAMAVIVNRQNKALEKQKLQLLEKEKENKITETLKAALEVQVAERTAALTLQKDELEHALVELKATQEQLIQSEKMASLGELTAGIAHEIQNPLNFVNNFSEVNAELITELEHEITKGNIEEILLITKDIRDNQEKITHHGKRAEAIVKGMLQHSRNSTGQKEPTDINALADEYLRLAYHGLRAKDKTFNAAMKTEFDPAITAVNVIPQDIGRVILNLITNGFYAVAEKKKLGLDGYEPTVKVSTRKLRPGANGGEKIEIRVSDNGSGIPKKILDKIFHPFFTTKPTGEGTGLGLSMSYEIITKGHGGELRVENREGEGATFIIQLPA
ncbi:MAG: ATP-binding protein [Bacteroidota bacterium]